MDEDWLDEVAGDLASELDMYIESNRMDRKNAEWNPDMTPEEIFTAIGERALKKYEDGDF